MVRNKVTFLILAVALLRLRLMMIHGIILHCLPVLGAHPNMPLVSEVWRGRCEQLRQGNLSSWNPVREHPPDKPNEFRWQRTRHVDGRSKLRGRQADPMQVQQNAVRQPNATSVPLLADLFPGVVIADDRQGHVPQVPADLVIATCPGPSADKATRWAIATP